jgi:predicted RNA-binding protein with PIN domain
MLWLVDGMNVIGTRPDGWWKDRHAAMERLVDQLESWAAGAGEKVIVVFERPPSPPIESQVIDVTSAAEAAPNAADEEIIRRLRDDPHPEEIRVVTSDRELADRVRALEAAVESAKSFRRRLDRP